MTAGNGASSLVSGLLSKASAAGLAPQSRLLLWGGCTTPVALCCLLLHGTLPLQYMKTRNGISTAML